MPPLWSAQKSTRIQTQGPHIEFRPDLILPVIAELAEPKSARRARQVREALEEMAKLGVATWPEEAQRKYMASYIYEPGLFRQIFRPSERPVEYLFAPGIEGDVKVKSPKTGITRASIGESPGTVERIMPIEMLPGRLPSDQFMQKLDEWLGRQGITDEFERKRLKIMLATGQKVDMLPEEEVAYAKRKAEALADAFNLTDEDRQDFIERASGILSQEQLSRKDRKALTELMVAFSENPDASIADIMGKVSPSLQGAGWKMLEKFTSLFEKERARLDKKAYLKLAQDKLDLQKQFQDAKIRDMEARRAQAEKLRSKKDLPNLMKLIQSAYRDYVNGHFNYARQHNSIVSQILKLDPSAKESYIDERPLSLEQWLYSTSEGQFFASLLDSLQQGLSALPEESQKSSLLPPKPPQPPAQQVPDFSRLHPEDKKKAAELVDKFFGR